MNMQFNPKLKLTLDENFIKFLNNQPIIPINIEISISGICNATCDWCFYRTGHTKKLIDKDVMLKTIDDLCDMGLKAITWTGGGEPSCHPALSDFINRVRIKQGLFTNGLAKPRYNPTKMEWIRVSKTNANWNIETLKKLRECKTLGMCINYTGDETVILEALQIAENIKADYVQVRPALNLGATQTNFEIPQIKHKLLSITDYKFTEARHEKTYTNCVGYHFVPFIWEDGNVDTCAYQKENKSYNLGNIYKTSIKEIINNYPPHIRINKDCQTCCKNHEINDLINMAKNIQNKEFV